MDTALPQFPWPSPHPFAYEEQRDLSHAPSGQVTERGHPPVLLCLLGGVEKRNAEGLVLFWG